MAKVQQRWALVRAGAEFRNGKLVEGSEEKVAA
jgi:hypothetical protein